MPRLSTWSCIRIKGVKGSSPGQRWPWCPASLSPFLLAVAVTVDTWWALYTLETLSLGPDVVQTPQELTACLLGWHGIEWTHHCKDSIQTGWDITGNVTSKTCCSWLGCEICFPGREIKSPIDGCLCTQLFLLAFIFLPERGVNIQLVSTAGVPLRSRKKCHWEQTRPPRKVSTGISRVSRRSKMKGVGSNSSRISMRKVFKAAAVWLEGSWGDLP